MDQAIDGFSGVHFLQCGQRDLPGWFGIDSIEADLCRPGFHQRLPGNVRDDFVVRINAIFWRVVNRRRSHFEQAFSRLAKPGQANYGLQSDTRILVAQRLHKQGGVHSAGLAFTVGEGAKGPFADGFVERQPGDRLIYGFAGQLLEREQRGDASMQVDRLVGGEPGQAVDMPAGTAFENLTLGVDPADGAVGNDVPEQVGVGRFGQVGKLGRSFSGKGDQRNAADVRAAVTVATVFPVADVHPRVAISVHVNGLDLVKAVLRDVEGAFVRREAVNVNVLRGEITRVERVVEGVRKAGFVQPIAARTGATAVVSQRRHVLCGKVFIEARIAVVAQRDEVMQACVPALAIVGIVAREDIELWADGDVVNVAGVECVVFQFGPIGSHADHTAAAQMKRVAIAALGLDKAVVANCQI